MLCSAGLQELELLSFVVLALKTCFFCRRLRRCSADNEGIIDGWRWALLLPPPPITSSICVKSCFLTTIFILTTPSFSIQETTPPPFRFTTVSNMLLLEFFWFWVLNCRNTRFGVTIAHNFNSIFCTLRVFEMYDYICFIYSEPQKSLVN